MLLRHFIAHLGSLGPAYHHCPEGQAKKSMRKKNKCDDSWALANESGYETSQKRISILRRPAWNVQCSHRGGKGLQRELAPLIQADFLPIAAKGNIWTLADQPCCNACL